MDITSPRPAVGTNSIGRPETVLYREAVGAELPPTQRVSQPATQGGMTSTDDGRPGDASRGLADRQARLGRIADSIREAMSNRIDKIVQDDDAGLLVYRTIDARTGNVVKQYPDDLTVKLRTYARQMERREELQGGDHAKVEKIA
jgi:hypothetical protein